jgi:hypothetical protein
VRIARCSWRARGAEAIGVTSVDTARRRSLTAWIPDPALACHADLAGGFTAKLGGHLATDRHNAEVGHLGWALDVPARLADHLAGRGARLIEVITAAGIDFTLACT